MPRESAEARQAETGLLAFASEREVDGRKRKDRAEEFRARLLRSRVLVVRGERPAPLGAPRTRLEYLPGEALLAAELLADGPERARAAQLALKADGARERLEGLLPGIARVERQGLRFDSALALCGSSSQGELLRERLRTLAQSGRIAEALAEARQAFDPRSEYALLVDLHLAAGEPAAARRVLGLAIAAGTPGSELALARRDLAEGRPYVARELAQSVLAKSPANREAWECFSLALLPPPRITLAANPAPRAGVSSPSPSTSP